MLKYNILPQIFFNYTYFIKLLNMEENIVINPELKNLLPPLSSEEYKILEESIICEGCRTPLLIWNGVLVDGHNRFEICEKHNIPFLTDELQANSIEDVKIWIIDNQKGRRNLTDGWKYELAQVRKEILLKQGKEKQKETLGGFKHNTSVLSTIDKTEHNTQKEIAEELGWSTGKVAMADKVWKDAKPEVKEKIKSGELTFNQAYKDVRREEKHKEREQRSIEGKNISINIDFRLGDFEIVLDNIPDNSVDCIITDPPYPYEFIECWSKLSLFAAKKLKENGFCIAYSGQYNLPEVIDRMRENLTYYWTFAVYHEGQTQIVNAVNLICRWKPVLVFQNGRKKIDNTFQDYFISEQREKDGHDWQQSKSGVSYLIEMFTKPGDLVVEPFAGSGTTIIACKNMNRNIIGAEIDEDTYNIAKSNIYDQTEK